MTSNSRNQDSGLLERAVSAFRTRTPDGEIRFAPEWLDLPPAQRDALFRLQLEARILEQAVDPDGLSSTAHLVLDRCRTLRQARR